MSKLYQQKINKVIKLLEEETVKIYWGNCKRFREGTAYAVGNIAYFPKLYTPNFKMYRVFIHELMHVRQYNDNLFFGEEGIHTIASTLECEYHAEIATYNYLVENGDKFDVLSYITTANKYMEYHKYIYGRDDLVWYHKYNDLPLKVPSTWMSKKRLLAPILKCNIKIFEETLKLRKRLK